MGIGIDNKYSSYYTQITNNYKSNTDRTSVSNTSTTDKTTTEDKYFKNLCDKYPNVNLNMSNSHLNKENKINFNVSPHLINKAMSNPEAAETLNKLLDKVPEAIQYINDNNYTLDGREVKNVSFVIDENGGVSCKCEYVQEDSENTNKTSKKEKEELIDKTISEDENSDINLSTYNRFSKDSLIQVWVNVEYAAKLLYNPEEAKRFDKLLDSLEEQMSSMTDYINGLGDILTGTEAKSVKVIIDKNGEVSSTTEFEQKNSENISKTNSEEESLEKQVEVRKEKAEALKEIQETDLNSITEQKLSYYYNM